MKICLVCEGVTSTDVTACASCGGRLLRLDEIHFPVRRGEEDAAHPLLGALIDGKYRVAGVLGRGGMGTVFRAVHEVSLVPTALKLLHPRLAGRVEYRAQFLAEARKAGRVVHEHTARILDVGETQDGSIYIAQELAPGNTMQEWLASERWPPQVLVEILRQVCGALVAAHAVGLVHRDLTPRNVMVDVRQGALHVKVLDFGIARGVAERGGGAGDDSLFASPPYAAPEHLAGEAVDGRADLYGLGVIAYEALCGRVPTPGSTSRDFAAATLAGELLPLSPREWAPKPLLALIKHLLARRADDRPESAADVLTSLDAIASPRNTRVRIGSLALLLSATILFGIAFRASPPAPFLSSAPGQSLELRASMPRGTEVQALRSEALFPLRCDFGAFDARRLTAEVWQNGEAVWRQDLRPLVRDGSLVLDRPQPEYLSLVDNIALHSRSGPVFLKFVVAGSPPLAYAVLQLDDAPPRVGLSLQKAGSDGTVNAETNLHIEMDEDHPGTLELRVTWAGTQRLLQLPVDARQAEAVSSIDLLGTLFAPPTPVRSVTLQLVAEDRAGNRAESAPVLCPAIDLGAPTITRVVGAQGEARTLIFGSNGVRLRVECSKHEADLQVSFGPKGGVQTPCTDVVEHGSGLNATWMPGTQPLEDGRYELWLRDAAGNGQSFAEAFTIASRRLDAVLSALAAEVESSALRGRAVVTSNGILSDGRPLWLEFVCNSLYQPKSIELMNVDGAQVVTQAVRLSATRDGGAVVEIDELADGRYSLTVRSGTVFDGDQQDAVYPLLVRRDPPTLHLPATARRRFLPQLAEVGAIAWQDGVLADGRAWSLQPADARWLRGNIWFGRGRPTAFPLPERTQANDALLPRLKPWPGENVLGLSVRDALDRPVLVLLGETAAPLLAGVVDEPDQPACELARFFWHTDPPRPRSTEVRVEHGQAARFVIDAPLPYVGEDGLELYVDSFPCRPRVITPSRDGGVSVEFALPFEHVQAAARLVDLSAEQFADNRISEPFDLWLAAPDGRYQFVVRAHTNRTTLEPVVLGATPQAALPASLRSVMMLPVLAPRSPRTWQDPVPDTVEARSTFRPGPALDVRNVEDCYLQQHETTREQYAQVAVAIAALAGHAGLPIADLVHQGDPRGAARLRLENLVPHSYSGAAAFEGAVQAEPKRAVAGLDFFQAYTFARAVGWLLASKPDLFRLPTGVELELAALGSAHQTSQVNAVLNAAARGAGVRIAAAQAAFVARSAGRGWPPTAAELAAAGDRVETELGTEMTGLDFGVREWVADLPVLVAERTRLLASSTDHVRHLEAATELAAAAGPGEGGASVLDRNLLRLGVVRGLALDELPSMHGEPGASRGRYGFGVPGVVRVLQLARDGSGVLPNESDPHLPSIGMRLCGGRAFLAWVRGK